MTLPGAAQSRCLCPVLSRPVRIFCLASLWRTCAILSRSSPTFGPDASRDPTPGTHVHPAATSNAIRAGYRKTRQTHATSREWRRYCNIEPIKAETEDRHRNIVDGAARHGALLGGHPTRDGSLTRLCVLVGRHRWQGPPAGPPGQHRRQAAAQWSEDRCCPL